MCLGNNSVDKTTSYTPNSAVANAATSNLNYANNLENTPFSPYSGNQVADFGPLQQQSFGEGASPTIANMIGTYSNAPAQQVTPGTISGAMSPYMNQYVNLALAPQLQAQNQQFDTQRQALDSAATSSGAFGDARAGIQQANLTTNQDLARQGLIGTAYTNAFNTAIGAGAQDVSNNLQGQIFNANNVNTALGRQLSGAEALQGNIGFQNTLGQQQTAQSQAQLNAAYNQWLMGQQRPFQNIQAADSAINAGAHAMPATATTSSPDNSGFGLLGSLAGTVLGGVVGGPVGASIGGSLGNSVGGWFGSSGNDVAQYTPDGGAGFGNNGQQLPGNFTAQSPNGYADGGEPPVGQPSIVGERGPELFVPHEPGTIIPHEALKGGFAGAFNAKPHVNRPRAQKNRSSMMPPAANSNIAAAFGAAA